MKRSLLVSILVSILLIGLLVGLLLVTAACAPLRPPSPPAGALATPILSTRTGGFAGFDDRVAVASDGAYTVNRRGQTAVSGQLAPAKQAALAAALAASGLFDADHRFETPGADQFTYTIAYNGHTVVAVDGAIPAAVQPLIDLLAALIS